MNEDDIVEHLRRVAPYARAIINSNDLVGWPIKHGLLAAADEIEGLRQEVAAWKNVAQELTMYGAMQELTQALNE